MASCKLDERESTRFMAGKQQMRNFELDARLAADSVPVADLELCSLRLVNDRRFPWLLLIPRRAGCTEVLDLAADDQAQLWQEVLQVAAIMRALTQPDKLNIATLGNQVAQLHIHVIARFRGDVAWPRPVWGVGEAEPSDEAGADLITRLRNALAEA